ncbi:wiskott-Aldrich syndrome protein family member 2 isoform X1 [Schistocerca piceifrons]|uniref:wiskott-Aldrich syndrome protein family member 2 isoform X1 n=1 Tax=Schistocerca piceifrons TaxID=274613 RepID=UPI001F5FDE6E|nr:wiskott-Aldrich syndrome protein family member 2 isoform X1 [Schistocerca piceifrons]
MPLPKRVVEPVLVSRGTIPEDFPLPSELEAATNGTLANLVRQLSSLSRHAEDIFGELARDAHGIAARCASLQARIDRLAVKVTQLDSNVEEVSLQDTHLRKAFKSSVVFDQQVVSRDTMPTAMMEMYQQCDKPPPLDKLNQYREDGKDGLKFYTDANYFFDLWRQEMLKDTERVMHDRGKKFELLLANMMCEPHRPRAEGGGGRHKKRVRQPHNTRERQLMIAVGHGEYIMPQTIYRSPQPLPPQHQQQQMQIVDETMLVSEPRPPRPNSIELRRTYPDDVNSSLYNSTGVYSPRHAPPPPHSPTDQYYRPNYVGGYDEATYQQHYAQGQTLSNEGYPTPNNHTPSRSNGPRGVSQRPSVPPPAPPSNNSSNSTPTVSSATNTPTRGRSTSTGRETLPPPPPPPVDVPLSPPPSAGPLSGGESVPDSPALQRAVSPERPPSDLPPPPPSPDRQLQPAPPVPSPPPPLLPMRPPSPCDVPPPPPPPPPPPVIATSNGLPNGPISPPPVTTPAPPPPNSPPLPNGDIGKSPNKQQIISTSPPKMSPPKAENQIRAKNPNVAPECDPRSDLLKAIRDGIKLRKVEKIEQKEVERVNALHDVASILARRVAVEFSDSDSASESEYDSEGWGDQETSA